MQVFSHLLLHLCLILTTHILIALPHCHTHALLLAGQLSDHDSP